MASTRVRFTISYVALAMGAVGAFAIALYVARLKLAEDQLYSQAIQTADDIVRDIQLSRERGYPLLVVDSTDLVRRRSARSCVSIWISGPATSS